MIKNMMSVTTALLLISSVVSAAEEVAAPTAKAEGFYVGVGGGLSYNVSLVSLGNFDDTTDTHTYTTDSTGDTGGGYIVYAGYQINKIIAVEAAYTDYGNFSSEVTRTFPFQSVTVKSHPRSLSVYANAGYTFANGLRPFGQIGLGYINVNGDSEAKRLDFIDKSVSMRFGLGGEYAPAELNGLGFRVAYISDVAMDFNYNAYNENETATTYMMSVNGMLYVGAQYKF